MNERRQQIEALFHAASAMDSISERQRFLDQACVADAALRAEVEELLESIQRSDKIFGAADQAIASRLVHSSTAQCDAIGSVIGRYKILEKIGEGGMGVVYLAEQEHPVRRNVALKVIKIGMDTRQVIARFEAERQALALMDHPNIAQVLDGGATESGRPYFVMELVVGLPITHFCAENQLPIRDRLRLFIPVCQAIQSAHQKGIIHRDLKPSNVLVTRAHPGADAHPMVIDFGVAKAINQKLTDKTLFTHFATAIGTPAYMSPEQAEISRLDVDTRADIYSLGALLYELLTGSPPFPEQRLRSVAYAEMQRILLEEEPERPSARWNRTSRSRADVPSCSGEIDSDLDAILLKCLEKDRERRYDTASALAGDIQRRLENQPVLARPPSKAYRLQKWIARNKLQFSTGIIVLVSLVIAVIVSSWQTARARQSEAKASEQARRAEMQARIATAETERANREAALARSEKENAEAIKQFLIDNLLGVNHVVHDPDPDALAYQATASLLHKVARSIEGRFTNQPSVEADLRKALFLGFTDLRNDDQALVQTERLLEIYQGMPNVPRTNYYTALCGLARIKASRGHPDQALRLLDPIMDESRRLRGGEMAALTYGGILTTAGRPAEAVPYFRQGRARIIEYLGKAHIFVKQATGYLAAAMEDAGNLPDAEQIWRQNIENCIQDHGADHPITVNNEFGLGRNLVRQRRADEALPLLRKVVDYAVGKKGANNFWTLDAQYWLGDALEQKGQIEQAARLYRDLHPRLVEYFPYSSAFFLNDSLSDFFVRHRLFGDARAAMAPRQRWYEANPPHTRDGIEAQIRVTAAVKGWPSVATLQQTHTNLFAGSLFALLNKAWLLRYLGHDDDYARLVKGVIGQDPASIPANDRHLPLEIAALGRVHFSLAERDKLFSHMTALQRLLPTRQGDLKFWSSRALAHMQFRLGKSSEALTTLASVDERVHSDPYALYIKAASLHRLGQSRDARQAFEKATALSAEQLPQPTAEAEPFLSLDQLYQHLVMHRETEALLAEKDSTATP